ncbi:MULTISPECIES: phosphotransferase enzyme family protein [unclassified Achromobacter]|uniref:phosphotransferase enzyme family protein n=1 Tax=unclassified Achromobacter TaxID=2626865 RepID=UPI000B51AB62|nr:MULTISPECIES: aminoglycoside phosphotransferase family protein [unclassified Achromobacter]OWT68135.1 aminoglycoside phosphotransferase [Achromobacter sp. HZ34]OWT69972.1 aminoglycoside phosphotransferase [Achromobacter sp. HZ28]
MIHVADRGSVEAPDTPDTLQALVHANWGLRVLHLQPLPSGHTNKSYLVEVESEEAGRDADCDVGMSHVPLILRVSWPGKAVQQVDREEALLAALGTSGFLPSVPRALQTLGGRSYVQAGTSWLHLFACIPGRAGFPQQASQGAESHAIAAAAMRTLAHLHDAMSEIPADAALHGMATAAAIHADAADTAPHPATWLLQRHARVSARAMPVLPDGLAPHYAEIVSRAGAYLAEAAVSLPGPTGWVHGDYHAGNLLFAEADRSDVSVTGILDFDDVGIGAPWLEAAFALFALARDATVEHRFAYDADMWEQGLDAYARQRTMPTAEAEVGGVGVGTDTMIDYLRTNRNALMNLFCIDQVLIHLEAAQRGLWSLGPGIGFLGCWHQLLSEASPSSILTASTVAGRASP